MSGHGPHVEPNNKRVALLIALLAAAAPVLGVSAANLIAINSRVQVAGDPSRYATFAELELYCRRVASAVGLASIEIFGYRNPRTREYAVSLGLADLGPPAVAAAAAVLPTVQPEPAAAPPRVVHGTRQPIVEQLAVGHAGQRVGAEQHAETRGRGEMRALRAFPAVVVQLVVEVELGAGQRQRRETGDLVDLRPQPVLIAVLDHGRRRRRRRLSRRHGGRSEKEQRSERQGSHRNPLPVIISPS